MYKISIRCIFFRLPPSIRSQNNYSLKRNKMKTTNCNCMESCSCMGEEKEGKVDSKINMKDGMGKCMEAMNGKMKGAKWFMLVPGLILVSAFLLTFFLNPIVVQTLWLVITGTFFVIGLLFMLMITLWIKKMKTQDLA